LHKTKEEKTSTAIKLNLSNGTLHVSESGVQLMPHNPDDLLTYKLKFGYNIKSTCAKFDKFLNEVLPDKNLQNILAEFLGYAFIPNNILKLEKVLMLYGGGANGKSVFKEISCELFGRENVSENTLEQLTTPNGYFVAELENKLINYSPEISGKIESAGIFKTLTSGEPLSVRKIYKDPTTIYNYARLAFNVNELPHNVQQTNAFFRRFLIVPFDITIAPEKQDKNLTQKIIKDELPGILNWVLSGLKRLLDQKGFTESNVVKEQLEEYRRDADSVLAFLADYRYKKSISKTKSLKTLFSEYLMFCSASGMPYCKDRTFSKRLKAADFKIERASFGMDVYIQQIENEISNG
ncbi:MAG TPA: phage/plasmid primase, P4 family, partial [Puia sp.]|nr:phage/plasmid primase, P4 family [Puia sp.]